MARNQEVLEVEFDTRNLTAAQIRMVKTLCTTVIQVMETDTEAEYFEESARLMRVCAALVSEASFGKNNGDIPYSQQVLEYSADILNDYIANSEVVSYDN